jgi:hypothetical protein
MRIAIIGAGNIGGNAARLSAAAGHQVALSFSRDPLGLKTLADEIGGTSDTPERAAQGADIVVLSVPWALVDEALEAAGGPAILNGSIIIDTTNQIERRDGALAVLDRGESSAARQKVPGARWVSTATAVA